MHTMRAPIGSASFVEHDNASHTTRDTRCRRVLETEPLDRGHPQPCLWCVANMPARRGWDDVPILALGDITPPGGTPPA